jgi:hypothetical protein
MGSRTGRIQIVVQAEARNQGQAMTNFIAECKFEEVIIENPSPDLKLVDPGSLGQILSQCWQLYVDGNSTQEGSGAGILFTTRFHSFTDGHIPSVCD